MRRLQTLKARATNGECGPMARRLATGFTLVEVAVTVLIVGISLTLALQTLNGATLRAGHTRNMKTARELGLYTLGQIESGLTWDYIDDGLAGSYSELDYPNFYYEVALGDESFIDAETDDRQRPFDNRAYQRELERQRDDYDEEAEEAAKQPYEKVRIKVTFPTFREYENHLTLERWIPWEQVYGPDEESGSGDGEQSEN